MKTIEIKNRFTGEVIFSHECEGNTILITLLEAINCDVDLIDADLSYANMSNAKGIDTAYMPIYCKWSLAIKGDYIRIGCKEKTVEEWDKWFESEEAYETIRGTEAFARIEASYKAYKAYYLTMKEFNNKQDEKDIYIQ